MEVFGTVAKTGAQYAVVAVAGTVVLTAGLFLYLSWQHHQYEVNSKKYNCELPPYLSSFPFGIPFVREVLAARKRKADLQFGRVLQERIGAKTFLAQGLGRDVIMTSEPDNIKAVLATQFKQFNLGRRHEVFYGFLGDGIFTLSGNGWYHSRAMLRPQFSNEQVSRLQDIEKRIQVLIKLFKTQSAGGKYFDISADFFRLTLDTATEFLFGESTDSLSDALTQLQTPGDYVKTPAAEFAECFNYGQDVLSTKTVFGPLHGLVGGSQFRHASKVCKSFIDRYVRDALEYTDPARLIDEKEVGAEGLSYVFLRELTKETRDPVTMRDQAMNILLAGRDTTASLLSYAFAILVRRPDAEKKLRDAVSDEFGSDTDDITFQSLKRCEYLKYFINETLRLYPTVPRNGRTAVVDTTLPTGGGPDGKGPMFVPKGMVVNYSTYLLHRDADLWGPDAGEFRPERWAEPKTGASWTYIPFNGGPRICLGQQFALTEAAYVIVRVLQSFSQIIGEPGTLDKPIVELANLTSAPYGGVNVTVRE